MCTDLFVLLCLVAGAASSPAGAQPAASQAPPVGVVPVERRAVEGRASFVGRVSAVDPVQIVARVRGFLRDRSFLAGQEVRAGNLLLMLERAPFEAAVASRGADLASALAAQLNADL